MMSTTTPPPQKNTRERMCVGCRKKAAPEALVRLVVNEGAVVVDAAGGTFGRGVHVHPSPACLAKVDLNPRGPELGAEIRAAYERRAMGILAGARRAGHLALGQDATNDALRDGAGLVVVAVDAGNVTRNGNIARAISEGRGVSFGTKAGLGQMLGTGETATLAVRHEGVARALQHALHVASAASGLEEQQ